MIALLYCVFAALCGWLEAILYARRGAEAFAHNEHVGMTFQRLAAAALVPAAALLHAWHGHWWAVAAELSPAALLFPLFHDEAYNFTRLWIDLRAQMSADYAAGDRVARAVAWRQYRYGYQSPTTTARTDFNGRQRTALALAGGVLLLALYAFLFFYA